MLTSDGLPELIQTPPSMEWSSRDIATEPYRSTILCYASHAKIEVLGCTGDTGVGVIPVDSGSAGEGRSGAKF